jgi:predicted adenylyl cyclase CyaB
LSQRDYYFTPPFLDANEKGSIVRVREEIQDGEKSRTILSYKTPNKPVGGVEAREEIEVEVLGDVQTLIELLKRIKVKPIVSVKKERTEYTLAYKGASFTVTLDKIETLGSFVEIELLSHRKGDIQQLIALGEELAGKLEIDTSRKIDLGYHELMLVGKPVRPNS